MSNLRRSLYAELVSLCLDHDITLKVILTKLKSSREERLGIKADSSKLFFSAHIPLPIQQEKTFALSLKHPESNQFLPPPTVPFCFKLLSPTTLVNLVTS